MFPLNQLLDRFKNLTNTEKIKKQSITELFASNNIPVKITQISITNTSVFIKTNPIIKTEILLKKTELLEQIKKIPGLSTISNIQ